MSPSLWRIFCRLCWYSLYQCPVLLWAWSGSRGGRDGHHVEEMGVAQPLALPLGGRGHVLAWPLSKHGGRAVTQLWLVMLGLGIWPQEWVAILMATTPLLPYFHTQPCGLDGVALRVAFGPQAAGWAPLACIITAKVLVVWHHSLTKLHFCKYNFLQPRLKRNKLYREKLMSTGETASALWLLLM